MLNVVNTHNTGHMHGVLPAHEGMRVRLTQKLNATAGLVQGQIGTIVHFVFQDDDAVRYKATAAGELFRPRYLPAGIWLQLDDFEGSPIHAEVADLVRADDEVDDGAPGPSMPLWWAMQQEKRAKGLFYLPAMETTFSWRSTEMHEVTRQGFTLTHAHYLTSTAAQGHTIRTGVNIDCARLPPQGQTGMRDDIWWFHLYVMFSRATRMSDMLLLRPPPRELLERGPPAGIAAALARFEAKRVATEQEAVDLANKLGFLLPPP